MTLNRGYNSTTFVCVVKKGPSYTILYGHKGPFFLKVDAKETYILLEVFLYQACENGLTLGQALQECCSVVQSFLSNCCQNCAIKT